MPWVVTVPEKITEEKLLMVYEIQRYKFLHADSHKPQISGVCEMVLWMGIATQMLCYTCLGI